MAQFAILFDGTGGSHARRFVVEPFPYVFHTVVFADTVNAGSKSPDIGRVGRKKSKPTGKFVIHSQKTPHGIYLTVIIALGRGENSKAHFLRYAGFDDQIIVADTVQALGGKSPEMHPEYIVECQQTHRTTGGRHHDRRAVDTAGAVAPAPVNTVAAKTVLFEFGFILAILPVHKGQVLFAGVGDTVGDHYGFGNIFDGSLKFEIFTGGSEFVAGNFEAGKALCFIGFKFCPAGLQRKISVDSITAFAQFDLHGAAGSDLALDLQRFHRFGSDVRQISSGKTTAEDRSNCYKRFFNNIFHKIIPDNFF